MKDCRYGQISNPGVWCRGSYLNSVLSELQRLPAGKVLSETLNLWVRRESRDRKEIGSQPRCPITIVEVIVLQYVWFSVIDMFGWLNGVMTRKLKVTEPMTSSVFAATMGTVESPFRLMRSEPMLGLILESKATPRPTTLSFEPAYVGIKSNRSLTLVGSAEWKTMGSVEMLSWMGRSISSGSP